MISPSIIFIISTLMMPQSSLAQERWCGKVYFDREGRKSSTESSPLPNHLIPPTAGPSFHAQPRYNVYSSHEKASVLFQVTQPFDAVGKHVWVSCHAGGLEWKTEQIVVPRTQISTASRLPIEKDMILLSGSKKYTMTCNFTHDNKLLASTISQVTILSESPKARIDRRHGAIYFNNQPMYPFGGMCSLEWISKDPERVLREEFIPRGLNTLHIVPGGPVYAPGIWKDIFQAAHKLGIAITYNMRHSYKNLTQVELEVKMFRNEPALMLWYTADEPDGWNEDLKQVEQAYHLIQSLDPHHPVSLVLNCQRFRVSDYARLADVIFTDAYPIGAKWCDSRDVNQTFGCCGCDECGLWKNDRGSGVLDVARRLDDYRSSLSHHAQPGPNDPHFAPLYGCLQAFGASEWWERVPTNDELRIMWYLAIIHGSTGLTWWVSPGPDEVEMMLGVLGLEFKQFAVDTLTMEKVDFTCSSRAIHVGAWYGSFKGKQQVLVIVANPELTTINFHVGFSFPLKEKVRMIVGKLGQASVEDGIYHDTLTGHETKVIIFSSDSSHSFISSQHNIVLPIK